MCAEHVPKAKPRNRTLSASHKFFIFFLSLAWFHSPTRCNHYPDLCNNFFLMIIFKLYMNGLILCMCTLFSFTEEFFLFIILDYHCLLTQCCCQEVSYQFNLLSLALFDFFFLLAFYSLGMMFFNLSALNKILIYFPTFLVVFSMKVGPAMIRNGI